MTDVSQALDAMMTAFNPDAAKGVNAVIQFNTTGEGGGDYFLNIANGKADYKAGVVDDANVTINVAAQDWLDIIKGELDPTKAFMTGKLKISGDLGLMMRFQKMFIENKE
jgi:putative sterol carrier protein